MAADRVDEIREGLLTRYREKAVPVIRHDYKRMEKQKPPIARVEECVHDILTLTRTQ